MFVRTFTYETVVWLTCSCSWFVVGCMHLLAKRLWGKGLGSVLKHSLRRGGVIAGAIIPISTLLVLRYIQDRASAIIMSQTAPVLATIEIWGYVATSFIPLIAICNSGGSIKRLDTQDLLSIPVFRTSALSNIVVMNITWAASILVYIFVLIRSYAERVLLLPLLNGDRLSSFSLAFNLWGGIVVVATASALCCKYKKKTWCLFIAVVSMPLLAMLRIVYLLV
jgi:hypothetical protein